MRGVPCDLINVLGHFQSFCNHKIFVKLNLPIFLVLIRQREKSQKYFNHSAFNQNLNHSDLCITLGALNFQMWELYSGSSGIWPILSIIAGLLSVTTESYDVKK